MKLKRPTLMLRNRHLSQAEEMAPFHLLDPALWKPIFPLLQLHQLAALLLPLLLNFAAQKLKALLDPRYAGCRCKIYVLTSSGLLSEQVLSWFA
jgi:hypothetical protein